MSNTSPPTPRRRPPAPRRPRPQRAPAPSRPRPQRRRPLFGALAPPPLAIDAPPVPEPAATVLREIVALYRQVQALPPGERPDIGRPGSPAARALEDQIAECARRFWSLIDV